MPGGITIEMDGLDEVLKKLDTKSLERDINDELTAFGYDVARDAKQNLSLNKSIDNGFLTNSIYVLPGRLKVEVGANIDYAAYVEFGTGPFAAVYVPSIRPEWQVLARKFYVNGKGRLPAKPYLYPAFEKNRIELIKRLKSLLKA